MSDPARSYRFGDANRPGLLLGLGARQAVPVIAGVLWLAITLQTELMWPVGLLGPVTGLAVAFGRWKGSPLAETLAPGARLMLRRSISRFAEDTAGYWRETSGLGSHDSG